MQRRSVIIGKPKSGQQVIPPPTDLNWGSMIAVGRTHGTANLLLYNHPGMDQALVYSQLIGDGNSVKIIAHDENYMYIGGDFIGTNQNRFAIIRKSDMQIIPFDGFNATVTSCVCDDSYIYVGGIFYDNFAIIRKSDFTIVSGTPRFNYAVWGNAIADDDTQLYVGGLFDDNFAIIRKSDFTIVSGTPTFTGFINAIADDAENIYLGGSDGFKVIRKSDYSVIKSISTGQVNAMVCDADYIYIGKTSGFNIIRKSDFSIVKTALSSNTVGDIYDDANYIYIGTQNSGNNFTVIRKSDFSTVANTTEITSGIWTITTI